MYKIVLFKQLGLTKKNLKTCKWNMVTNTFQITSTRLKTKTKN